MQQAVECVIRPRRKEYDLQSIPFKFTFGDKVFSRLPVEINNNRNQKLVGSLYFLADTENLEGMPCVIYLHGNTSSQLEGQFLIPNICPYNIALFCFDFAGCGVSDGNYISLGFFESLDTNFVIESLGQLFQFRRFILWGRSMGAATALITHNKHLLGKIADSSFASLKELIDIIASQTEIPSILQSPACWLLKSQVEATAHFDINAVNPIAELSVDNVPTIFGHAKEDKMIPYSHSARLYEACMNPMKMLMPMPGGHNSRREADWLRLCIAFIIELFHGTHIDTINIYEFNSETDLQADVKSLRKKTKKRKQSEEGGDGVRRKSRRNCDD